MARHADYVKKTFVLNGPVARELAALLEMDAPRASRLVLEVPATMEHFERIARRLPGPSTMPEPDVPSATLSAALRWDPRSAALTLGEHWYDMATAIPHQTGPRYQLLSPLLPDDPLRAGSWAALHRALRVPGPLGPRSLDFAAAPDVHVRLALIPWTGKLFLSVAVGPPIAALGGGNNR